MTVHGTPLRTIRNAISRAKGIANARIRTKKTGLKWKKIRNKAAYDAAVAKNRSLGITPPRKNINIIPPGTSGLLARHAKRKKITLPKLSFMEGGGLDD